MIIGCSFQINTFNDAIPIAKIWGKLKTVQKDRPRRVNICFYSASFRWIQGICIHKTSTVWLSKQNLPKDKSSKHVAEKISQGPSPK